MSLSRETSISSEAAISTATTAWASNYETDVTVFSHDLVQMPHYVFDSIEEIA